MAISFIIGHLLGRALFSYVLVWTVCWLVCRLDWREALRRSGRWYSLLAVVVLTLLGIGGSLVRQGVLR